MLSAVDDAVAHVEYVVKGAPTVRAAEFLADVLTDPVNALAVAGGGPLSLDERPGGVAEYSPLRPATE